jgi:membrane fusion protein (multidrug efflux system)
MKRMSRSIRIAIVALVVVAAGCAKKQQGGGGFQMPPTPVEIATVTQGRVVDRFEAVGTIQAGEAITVVTEISGTVVRLPFREGEEIGAGTLIAQIDDVELRAEVARAEALRDQRQNAFERIKSVVEQRAGSPQDLDDAAATLKVAEAELALAKARLDKASIEAPFSGIVGSRRVSPGAFLSVGDVITELAQVSRLKIVFAAPERFLGQLKRGSAVTVSTTAFPGLTLKGDIDVVEPVLDEATRNVRVIARVQNLDGHLRPGMSADVAAVLSERPDALTIPSEAVFAEGDQMLVFTVSDSNVVARTPITLGLRLPDAVEVLDGLEAGARVVRAGHQKLYPGAMVMPIDAGGGAGAGGGAPGGAPAAAGDGAAGGAGAHGEAAAQPAADPAPGGGASQ